MAKFDPELIIFDMDGTILDTLEDIRDSLNHTLVLYGFPERSLDEVRQFVGSGSRKLIERALPKDAAEADIEKVHDAYGPCYRLHCNEKTKPYPGVTDLIASLKQKGYLTAVVSNKPDPAVQELCRLYFDGLFDYALGAKEGIRRKPAPDSVFAVMETLQVKEAIYVGDSDVDLETARNAGVECISVTWGFRDRDFLAGLGAEHFADTADDVLRMLS